MTQAEKELLMALSQAVVGIYMRVGDPCDPIVSELIRAIEGCGHDWAGGTTIGAPATPQWLIDEVAQIYKPQ